MYQTLTCWMNIQGLICGNRLAQTRTEPAGSRFSWNRYSRNGPKTEPLPTLIMPALMSSTDSPATVTSSTLAVYHSQWKCWQRHNKSATWFFTPRMRLVSQSRFCMTITISIWCTVRRGCVRIPPKVTWSMSNKSGCSAPCRSSLQHDIGSRMPKSSVS